MASKKNKNTKQLIKVNTKDKLIEFNEFLDLNTFKEDQEKDALTATIHSSLSRINIKICDFGGPSAKTVGFNLSPAKIKGMAQNILHYRSDFEAGKRFEKINPHQKNEAGLSPVSKFEIRYTPLYNGKPSQNPWYIAISNGVGEAIKNQNTGGINIKAGSYKETGKAFINLPMDSMIEIATTVYDYINHFERTVFPTFYKNRAAWEKEAYKK